MTVTYYTMRMVKDGPLAAVKVWFGYPVDPDTGETLTERPQMWRCQVNGQDDAIEAVMIELDGVTGLPVIKGHQCDELEYLRILKTHEWALTYAPHLPEAQPRKAIDHLAGDTIF